MDVGLSDGAKRKYDSFTGRSSAYTALGAEGTNAEYYYYQRGENGTVVSIPISEKISTDISTRVGSMYGKEMQKAEPRKSFPDGLKKFCEMAVAGSLDSSGSTSDQAGSSSTLGTLTGPSAPPMPSADAQVAKPRRGSVQELNVEAECVTSRAAYPAFERTIAGELPMRLNFQTDLSLKGASSADFPDLLRQLSDSRLSGKVDVLCMSSLPGLKGAKCMRAVIAYLIAHPHVWALNLGERSGFAFSDADYNILCEGVESGHTGLALCWIEHQGGGLSTATTKRRFFEAVNNNRIRLQEKARAVLALTRSEEAAMRLIPWRDRDYRQRLVENTRRWTGLTLGEYTCMGQHHLKKGVDIWGVVGGKLETVEKGTPAEEKELNESDCYVPNKDKSASSSPSEALTDLVDRLRRDLQSVNTTEALRDTVDRLRRESEAVCRHRDELQLRAAPCISEPDHCVLNARGSIAGRFVKCHTDAGDFGGRVIRLLPGGHAQILWHDHEAVYRREEIVPWIQPKSQSERFTIRVGDENQAAIPDLVPPEDSTQLKRQRTPP